MFFEKVTESFSCFNWVFLVILSSEIFVFRKWHVKKARASLGFNLTPFFGLWIRWILSIDVIQPFSLNVKLFKLRSGICCAILRSWAVGETQIKRTSTNDQMSRSHEFHFGDSFVKWSYWKNFWVRFFLLWIFHVKGWPDLRRSQQFKLSLHLI